MATHTVSTSVREEVTPPLSTVSSSSFSRGLSRPAVTVYPQSSSPLAKHHATHHHSETPTWTKAEKREGDISLGCLRDIERRHTSKTAVRGHCSQPSDEVRKMLSFLEKLRTDHQRSLEDKKSIAEVIERKLQFHQRERMVLEDARVARLRDQLAKACVDDAKKTSVETLNPLSDSQLNEVIDDSRDLVGRLISHTWVWFSFSCLVNLCMFLQMLTLCRLPWRRGEALQRNACLKGSTFVSPEVTFQHLLVFNGLMMRSVTF